MREFVVFFVKAVLSFFIPLVWTLVFYALARKAKKSLVILMGVVALFSLFSVGVMWKLSHVMSTGDTVAAMAGVYVGIAAVVLLFGSKLRWLQALPATDAYTRSAEREKRIHLRHVLSIAIRLEDRARKFYEKLAESTSRPSAKELYQRLARDEIRHRDSIETTLYRWLPLPVKEKHLSTYEKHIKTLEVFMTPPPDGFADEDAVKYAIQNEKRIADFYHSFESAFPEAWKKMHIQKLVQEETKHVNDLIASHPQFKDMAIEGDKKVN